MVISPIYVHTCTCNVMGITHADFFFPNMFYFGNAALQFTICHHSMETTEIKYMRLHTDGFEQNAK